MSYSQIEKDFDVSKIKHKNTCIWPIIKSYLITLEPSKNEILKKTSSQVIWTLLKGVVPDIFSIYKVYKSDNWVFTNSERRYAINNIHFDRITSGLLKYTTNYVLFENPIPKGKTKFKKLQKGEFIIGMSFIFFIQFILLKLIKKPNIKGLKKLEKYLKKDLESIKNIYHRYHVGFLFYNFIFKFKKPKAVFVVCYYSNFGLLKACKKNKIPVIELQHGLVTKEHRAYNFSSYYGDEYIPDYFLSYGPYFTNIIKSTNFVSEENILDYGYSFIFEVNKNLEKSIEFTEISKKFEKVICITGQLENTDTELLSLINSVAEKFSKICFIYKPRNTNNNVNFLKRNNILKWEKINTYELIKFSDYHMTVYSTCALESLALGTPNISVDIDGLYSTHLKGIIGANKYNHVVTDKKSLESLLDHIKSSKNNSKKVAESSNYIFSPMISRDSFYNFFNKIVE
ncbi:hypothetical protein KO500_05995 [Cellulophaga baltica]|uniref:hypothetical protein n=1 Tax=Cellulophaga TaxID=104264 RepID=UPI001C073B68|nr:MULTISPECIES: hypothetical protein [Cellulophaga]MBU2995974.1 hypothetical protein [Cellulophaga baltica]MDO6767369.1 hypothetical protein [Cellulophaga sp. 1_MG-2023]